MINRLSILVVAAAAILALALPMPAQADSLEPPASEILGTVVVGNRTVIFATAKLSEAELNQLRTWDQFAQEHPGIAGELGNSPSRLTDGSYLKKERELDEFLTAHPDIRQAMLENPGNFVVARRHR